MNSMNSINFSINSRLPRMNSMNSMNFSINSRLPRNIFSQLDELDELLGSPEAPPVWLDELDELSRLPRANSMNREFTPALTADTIARYHRVVGPAFLF